MALEIEYKQWIFITHDLYDFVYKELELQDHKMYSECRNILQHWLLMVNQDENIVKYKYYPLLPVFEIIEKEELHNKIAVSLVKAIKEKNFFWKGNFSRSATAVSNILRFIDNSHKQYKRENLTLNPIMDSGIVKLEDFVCENFVNLPFLISKFDIVDVTRMILRYESIGNGSYQWGDPKELHMCYYNHYNVRYEGFASPFNSRFIGLSDCRFCSLFPDTDTVFGSLGNFFNVDLSKYPGAWSVNPPFINDVMDRVSDKIIETLKAGVKSTFFLTYPYWNDSTGWMKLNKSKYLLEAFHRSNNIVIQDAYGRVFAPANGLSLFVLSYYKLNLNNVAEILDKGLDEFDTSFNAFQNQTVKFNRRFPCNK